MPKKDYMALCLLWLKKPRSWVIIGAVFVGIALLVLTIGFLLSTRGGVEVNIADESVTAHEVDRPLTIKFSRQLGQVRPSIEPSAEGDWLERRHLFGISELEFAPTNPLKADTEYKITFKEARRPLFGDADLPNVTFRTQKAPQLTSTSLDNAEIIAMDQRLTVTLGSRVGELRNLEMTTTPELALKRSSNDDVTFAWEYEGLLSPDTEYIFTLRDSIQEEELKRVTVKTAPMPTVATPVKEVGVSPADELKLTFTEAIATENRPDITFDLAGSGNWRSDTEFVFKADKLEPGRTYSYSIPKGLRTARGGILVEDQAKTFATNGVVRSAGVSPWNKVVDQGSQDVRITFNQAVDHKSAVDRFRVSSGAVQGISWQGNTMVARVVNMGFQRQVQAWVEPGVMPVFGLASTERIATSFTTDARTVKLNVPSYRQVYAQSCEASSLRMALAYRGTHDSDWNILQKFGYNPRPRDNAKNEWDDPNLQFVGDVRGDQGRGTGWGVYAGPVARAASQYGRGTALAYGANAGFVAQQIHAGNPVIAWGVWRVGAKIDSWTTPAGKTVSGPIPMHVRLIIGVKGEPHDPIGFYVNDPITGPAYWTRAQFTTMTAGAGPAAQLLAIQ